MENPLSADATLAEILKIGSTVAQQNAELHINGTPFTLVPEGWRLDFHPELRGSPDHIQATITCHTFQSFIDYLIYFDDESSTVFVDLTKAQFVAILDYHLGSNITDWCQHRTTFDCPKTQEFTDWQTQSGKPMTQTAFAEFIEDHLPDIIDPPGAELAEIARSLQANVQVKFSKAIRLDNGQTQLQYHEEINGTAGATGQFKIPQTIKLGLKLFKGGEPYAVEARFKYRIKDGALTLWHELVRPERLLENAIGHLVEQLKAAWPGGRIYYGTP